MKKNIVVLSDGTGQEGGKGHDIKLFKMLENRTEGQMTFYDRGLGTGWRGLVGKATGMGISQNIKECYRFIFENYNAGDEVFLFGFSRGATTVRSLSGFIYLFGILPKSRPELIDRAYRIYKIQNGKRRLRVARQFVKSHHSMWCHVKFLGVWDTVTALGVPFAGLDILLEQIPWFRHRFHNLRLSKCVKHARHALAIDDERLTFHPTLWDPTLYPGQEMQQRWFAGMHTDVGGGYQDQSLADIPMQWMLSEAQRFGLRIYEGNEVELNPDPNGEMHNSRAGFLKRFYRRRTRRWNTRVYGKPDVHPSVNQRTLNQHNETSPPYRPWIVELLENVERDGT
ncbi:MAG: DUF2235 domain-containing protein [Pirellulales bacterium]|nr:DUF2235 domain-containing protein [Pirellulales bacterium]